MTVIGDELLALGWRSNSIMSSLVHLCYRFSESNEWLIKGSPTPSHWIARQLDVEVCTAREWIRIGRCLKDLPLITKAFAEFSISYSKVRALTRFADADNEAELLMIAQRVPAGQLTRALAAWSLKNEGPAKVRKRHQRERGVFASTMPDGSHLAIVRLPAFEGSKIMTSIDASVMTNRPDASADAYPSLAQQRADALVRLLTDGGSKVETELVIHVRGNGCEMDDGTPIADSIIEELAPISFIRTLIHDSEGKPINASSKQRHPSERQKRVVKERDRVCVDCGSSDFLEYDHIPAYEITKHTLVDELELRCSRCHKLRHRAA